MVTNSLSRDEAVRRAGLLFVTSYAVELRLSQAETFHSRSTIRFDCREPGAASFVELADAVSATATLNGVPVPPDAFDDTRIRLRDLRADNELVVEATLPCVTSGDGMHRYLDPADGATYLCAYTGMDVARRVFACFDQLDLKAPISLTVTAPETWTVLANGRETSTEATAGAVTHRFATTPPIPTSQFVACAGPWHSITWQHAGLSFGWHARRSMADTLARDVDELRRVTTACFDHYAEVFDEPFAFDSYDQVMCPGLNWGAMEFPGCVAFRDELLFVGGASDAERQLRGMIIAHEMAHMWFGDLVTMRWWDDAWLSESFADYMGFQVASAAAGFPGAWTAFTLSQKLGGYAADERRSTHPVAPTGESVVDVDTAFGNFDEISYAKGNSVLRQLVTWLGVETFLRGANRYLTRHAFGNAELADFLDALDSVTEREVRRWAELWLQTPGFDTLVVRRDDDVPVLSRTGTRPHRTRVMAFEQSEGVLVERGSRMVDLDDADLRLEDWRGLVVLPNAHDETFARVRTDVESWRALVDGASHVRDDQARAVIWATAVEMVLRAEMTPDELVAMVDKHLPRELLPSIWEPVMTWVLQRVLPRHLPADRVATARATLASVSAATIQAAPGLRLAATRCLAACTDDTELLLGWLDDGGTADGVAVDSDLRWRVLTRLAELAAVDGERIDREAGADTSTGGQTGAARARAAMPDPDAKARAWAAMAADEVGNRVFSAAMDGFWVPEQAALVAPYVDRYLAEAPRWAERRGQGFSLEIGHAFPRHSVDQDTVDKARAAIAGDVPTVLRRVWEDRLDDLVADLAVRRVSLDPRSSRASSRGVHRKAEEGGDAPASTTDDNAARCPRGGAQQTMGSGDAR